MTLINKFLGCISENKRAQLKHVAAIAPIQLRLGPYYWQWRYFLSRAQKWQASRIEAWQLKKIKSIVKYAYENIEGYRELYKRAGVSPQDIVTLRDVKYLPFTDKKLFQENLETFSANHPSRRYATTGGSTGIPFGFYMLPRNRIIENAFMHAGWSSVGWELGVRNAILRGAFVGSKEKTWMYDFYRKELHLSSYYLTKETIKTYIEIINRYQTKVLQAYPSSLNLFSDLLQEVNMVGAVSFNLILLGSENVYDWQIEKFKKAFPDAVLFSWYGHSERAILAHWCRDSRKYHVWPFYGLAEIIGKDNCEVSEGEEGELVGTSFHNYATPFIRYRTMDRAIKGHSSCNWCKRNFHLIEQIKGRSHEVIVTCAKRYISMTAINMHDDIFNGIRQFQFLQEQPGKVVFKYVPKYKLSEQEIKKITKGLKIKLGEDMELNLIPVDEIPRNKTGKYSFLDQRLSIQYGDCE